MTFRNASGLYVNLNANETTLRQTGTFLGIDLMSLTQATILAVALLLQSPILYAICTRLTLQFLYR